MCKTGSGAGRGNVATTTTEQDRRQINHERTKDQAGRRTCANVDADGSRRVHTADDIVSRNAATRSKNCNFMCQEDVGPGQQQV